MIRVVDESQGANGLRHIPLPQYSIVSLSSTTSETNTPASYLVRVVYPHKSYCVTLTHKYIYTHNMYTPGPWFDMYLADRRSIMLNYNPYVGMQPDPRTSDQVCMLDARVCICIHVDVCYVCTCVKCVYMCVCMCEVCVKYISVHVCLCIFVCTCVCMLCVRIT